MQAVVPEGEVPTVEEADALARGAWEAIARIFLSEEAADLFRRAAETVGLSERLLAVLMALSPEDGKSMSRLAEECRSTASYMTVAVDGLEERGLVERRDDPEDRRVNLVVLTEEGLETVREARERIAQPPSGITALSREELTALRALLEKAARPYPWDAGTTPPEPQ